MPSERDITITMGADADSLQRDLEEARKVLNSNIRKINAELKKLGQEGMTSKQTKVFDSLKKSLVELRNDSKVIGKEIQNTFAQFMRGEKIADPKALQSIEKLIKKLLDLNAEGKAVTTTVEKLGSAIAGIGVTPTPKSSKKGTTGKEEVVAWAKPSEALAFSKAGLVDVKTTVENYNLLTAHLKNMKQAYIDCSKGIGAFATESKAVRSGVLPLLSAEIQKTEAAMVGAGRGFRGMASGIKGIITQIKQMIEWQAVWYGSRAILFALVDAPITFQKTALEFGMAIDNWKGQLLRWESTTGTVSENSRKSIDAIIVEARRATIDIPLSFEKINEALEGFIGAGVPLNVIKSLVPAVAKLKAAFPDIDFQSFGVAISGAWNAFKEGMTGAVTEAGKFNTIMEQLLRAQARGIIRPEQFTVVIQHLGEMSRIAGFTTEEMFAMAVTITDMGSRAGNAARSLRGMMDQLAKPRTFKKLTEAGVELNTELSMADMLMRKFTLASGREVPSILEQLGKVLGTGSGKSYKALSFLSEIFPAERSKSLTGMMDQLNKFKDLLEDIKGAQGAIDKANEVMAQRFEGQIQIMKNRWREFASAIGMSSGIIKETAVIFNDVLLGALIAVDDKVITFGKSLTDLGAVGITAYSVMKSLQDTFIAITAPITVLTQSMYGFAKSLSAGETAVKAFAVALRALADIVVAGLLTGLIGKLLSLAGVWMGLEKGASAIGVITGAFKGLFALIKANWMIFAGILALQGIKLGIDTLQSKKEEAAGRSSSEAIIRRALGAISKGEPGAVSAAGEELQARYESQLAKLRAMEEDLNKPENKNKPWFLRQFGYDTVQELKKDVQALKDATVELEGALHKNRLKEKLKGNVPETDKSGTGAYSKYITEAKKALETQLKNIGFEESVQIKELESLHRLGILGESEYAAQILSIDTKLWEDRSNLISAFSMRLQKGGDLYDKYQKAIGKAQLSKRGEEAEALQEKLKNDQEWILSEQKKANKERAILDIRSKEAKKKGGILDAKVAAEREFIVAQQRVDKANWEAEERKKAVDWLYTHGLVSAEQYYSEEEHFAAAAYRNAIELHQAEYQKWYDTNKHRGEQNAAFQSENEKELDKRNKAITKDYEKYISNLVDITRKGRDDIKLIWSSEGFKGVFRKALTDLAEDFGNMGKHWETMMKDVASAMSTAFQDFFFDTMVDELKSFEDYLDAFLRSVAKALSNVMAQFVSYGITTGVKSLFNMGGAPDINGLFGTPAMANYVPGPVGHKGGLIVPKFHGGGEVDAKVLTGEYIVSRKGVAFLDQINQGKGPIGNVNIVINNKTGVQTIAKQTGMTFDTKKQVKTIFLDLMRTDPQFRQQVGRK